MNIKESFRGALRRMRGPVSVTNNSKLRRTQPLPLYIGSAPARDGMPKATPANLRRFAETPVARKAINTIKDRIAGMRWRIQPRRGRALELLPAGAGRGLGFFEKLEAPHPDDSFRSMAEQVLEDIIVGGFGAIELALTGDEERPLFLWPVDGATIRMKPGWDGLPNSVRYVQVTGQFGSEGNVELNDDELIYI